MEKLTELEAKLNEVEIKKSEKIKINKENELLKKWSSFIIHEISFTLPMLKHLIYFYCQLADYEIKYHICQFNTHFRLLFIVIHPFVFILIYLKEISCLQHFLKPQWLACCVASPHESALVRGHLSASQVEHHHQGLRVVVGHYSRYLKDHISKLPIRRPFLWSFQEPSCMYFPSQNEH